jgi:hypothetical protein
MVIPATIRNDGHSAIIRRSKLKPFNATGLVFGFNNYGVGRRSVPEDESPRVVSSCRYPIDTTKLRNKPHSVRVDRCVEEQGFEQAGLARVVRAGDQVDLAEAVKLQIFELAEVLDADRPEHG